MTAQGKGSCRDCGWYNVGANRQREECGTAWSKRTSVIENAQKATTRSIQCKTATKQPPRSTIINIWGLIDDETDRTKAEDMKPDNPPRDATKHGKHNQKRRHRRCNTTLDPQQTTLKHRQELTSHSYLLRHRVHLFGVAGTPTITYGAGTWVTTQEHENMFRTTQR